MKLEKIFGNNLKNLVDDRGYASLRAFANENDFDYQRVWGYANGIHLPSMKTAWRLALALECTIDDFMKGAREANA